MKLKKRTRTITYRTRYKDEHGKWFCICVPNLTVVDYWVNGKWEETMSCTEIKRIEDAITAKRPNWFKRYKV